MAPKRKNLTKKSHKRRVKRRPRFVTVGGPSVLKKKSTKKRSPRQKRRMKRNPTLPPPIY